PDLRLSPTGAGPFTYDWTYYEIVRTAPTEAVYFRSTWAGIYGNDSRGEGWIDSVQIRPAVE
ncbi:MAG: hypothetical protein U1E27_02830, partial [Kiritimatiellia bacterium]|nr:hypothetical protein [Kiritimatiellia bacterium]